MIDISRICMIVRLIAPSLGTADWPEVGSACRNDRKSRLHRVMSDRLASESEN
jgi:hypothetical protein